MPKKNKTPKIEKPPLTILTPAEMTFGKGHIFDVMGDRPGFYIMTPQEKARIATMRAWLLTEIRAMIDNGILRVVVMYSRMCNDGCGGYFVHFDSPQFEIGWKEQNILRQVWLAMSAGSEMVVQPEDQKEGKDLTEKWLAWAAFQYEAAQQKKIAKEKAEDDSKAAAVAKFAKAKETGTPQMLWHYVTEECTEPSKTDGQCSCDSVTILAMPDGSRQRQITHSY